MQLGYQQRIRAAYISYQAFKLNCFFFTYISIRYAKAVILKLNLNGSQLQQFLSNAV